MFKKINSIILIIILLSVVFSNVVLAVNSNEIDEIDQIYEIGILSSENTGPGRMTHAPLGGNRKNSDTLYAGFDTKSTMAKWSWTRITSALIGTCLNLSDSITTFIKFIINYSSPLNS